MEVDLSRIEKIGIDRIVINNFNVLNFDKLEKKQVINNFEYSEKIEIKDKKYNLVFSENLTSSGEIYNYSSLEFNPNKIKDNHNLYNSDIKNLEEALNYIIKDLKSKNIEVDLSEAKIKELELNTTVRADFEKLGEVMLLIGKANYKKALGIYSFLNESIPELIKKDRCLYINNRLDFKKENNGKVIKLYDKTFELYTNQNIFITEKLTRIEVLFGRDFYRLAMEKEGISNNLTDLLESNLLEKLFFNAITTELITKPIKSLKELKRNLNYDFLNFRKTEKLKRTQREKLKKLGSNIPEYLIEERGVFEYLKRNSWIFDYSFLYQIVNENISSKHKKVFEKQIMKKYLEINNKKLYEDLISKVLKTNFFCQVN